MNTIYAVVGSITTATRLARELKRRGAEAAVCHTPANKTGGCSYSVRINETAKPILMLVSKECEYKIKRIIKGDEK